jgi:hypothetical protein
VSTQPLLVVLLLLWLERTWRLGRWTILEGVASGLLLGLLVYSYTGSRLLGPLLAAVLAVFAGRGRWRWLVSAWAAFAAALLPVGVYALRHPGALTARYEQTTIARDGRSPLAVAGEAVGNWFKDANPWHWATAGDPAPYVHNGGYGALYAAVVALAIAGAVLVLRRERENLWWRYVLVATLVVPIPAALTVDRYNAIRLAALPVFALTLAIPAIAALVESARTRTWARVAAGALVVAVAFQFVQFLDEYRTRGPARTVLFDAGMGPLLEPVFDDGETIYVDYDDRGAQIQARWHAVERGLPADRVVVLPDGGVPPPGSVVLGLFQECDFPCDEFARWEGYRLARSGS